MSVMRFLLRKLRPVQLRPSFFYWMVGVVLFIALSLWVASWGLRVSQDWQALQQQPTDATKKRFDASLDVVKAIVGGVGTVATIGGGVFVLWNLRLTQTRLITERFSKAVEQLGSDKIEVRLGGIYALESIAYDSDRDHWTIIEVLTSFIQERSPRPTEEQISLKAYELWQNSSYSGTEQEHWNTAIRALGKPVTKDVQAALTVIGRRQKKDTPAKRLDLSNTNLQGANLWGANLQRAILNRANLQGSFLNKANLQGANLSGTNFQGANLWEANLQETKLWEANLQETKLWEANLQRADLDKANLQRSNLWKANLLWARLIEANLQEASLREANLQKATLNGASLQEAILSGANLQKAILSDANLNRANLSGIHLDNAYLWNADLSDANLSRANLNRANLSRTNLSRANLSGADLSRALLYHANLSDANLSDANLSDAVLLATDLRHAQNFDPTQLGGEKPPLLCHVALPEVIKEKDKLKDRDCDRLPQELLKRYPKNSLSLEEAKEAVDDARQVKWE